MEVFQVRPARLERPPDYCRIFGRNSGLAAEAILIMQKCCIIVWLAPAVSFAKFTIYILHIQGPQNLKFNVSDRNVDNNCVLSTGKQ